MNSNEKDFYKCSIKLLDKVKDVSIAVLASKIYFRCNVGEKLDGYTLIRNNELTDTIYVEEKTLKKYIDKLEGIGFIKTKRGYGCKYYKVNKRVANLYF